MSQNSLKAWKLTFVLLTLILFGCWLRWTCLGSKQTPSHDECISYLAACGNQGKYALHPPACEWHTVGDIHLFFEMNPEASWRQIRDDLARYDIHPPLYFWLLNLWLKNRGISPQAGPALNLVFVFFSALGLFFLGRRVFSSTQAPLLAVFIWLFSPMVASISLDARQYELLGTVSIYYLLSLLVFIRPDRGFSWMMVLPGLLTTLGLLTHFYFAILIAGAALTLLILAIRGNSNGGLECSACPLVLMTRIFLFFGITLLGMLLFFLIDPSFLNSFSNQRSQALPFSISGLISRIGKTIRCGIGFFVYPREWIFLFLGVVCLAVVPVGYFWKTIVRHFSGNPSILKPGSGGFLTILSCWYGGWTVLLYICFLTPGMGGRYLAPFWPLFSLGLVAVFYRLGVRSIAWILPLLCFHLLVGGGGLIYGYRQEPERQPPPLLQGEWLLVDSVQRGSLPRVCWNLDPEMALLACSQDELLSLTDDWVATMPKGSGLFAAVKMYNSPEKSLRILDLLKKRYSVELVLKNWLDLVDFYRLQTPQADPRP